MARTPPQTLLCRRPRRRGIPSVPVCRTAMVGLMGLWPFCDAQAARSCDEWSAEVSSVEGRVEIRRSATATWVALAAGERVCTDDSIQVGSSSRATLVLPDGGGPIRLDEHSILNLPEPPSGVGSLLELLRGIIHVISRDPRSLSFRTPYANAGIEGTEFDIRVDEDERLTEIVVLEGEVAVTTPNGELKVSSDHVAVARDGQAPTASPIDRPIERMRWASHYPPIIERPLPGADQVPLPSQQADADFYAYRAAARLTTARLEGAEADIATALRLAPRNAAALSLDAVLSLARADRDAARARVAEALAADPMSVVARIALSHVEQSVGSLAAAERSHSRSACDRARQRNRRDAAGRDRARPRRCAGQPSPARHEHARWPRTRARRSSCSALRACAPSTRPLPRAHFVRPSSSSPRRRCHGSAWL